MIANNKKKKMVMILSFNREVWCRYFFFFPCTLKTNYSILNLLRFYIINNIFKQFILNPFYRDHSKEFDQSLYLFDKTQSHTRRHKLMLMHPWDAKIIDIILNCILIIYLFIIYINYFINIYIIYIYIYFSLSYLFNKNVQYYIFIVLLWNVHNKKLLGWDPVAPYWTILWEILSL